MSVLSLFRCKKTFLPFFHFFLFFGLSFLSFFLASLLEKRSFFAPLCAPRVYSFAAALSPLCEKKKRAFHVLKEEEEEEEQSFVDDRRVRVIGKAALFFLKTGEKKKEAFPREFH